MSMKLHHNPISPHSRRVHMAILELGLDVEIKALDFMKGEHKDSAFLAHNPNGKVPMLEDGAFWLWESNAILAYLADKAPQKGLYPTEPQKRADVNRWLFWESAHFGAACARLTSERVIKPMMMKQQPDPAMVADGEANWQRYGAVLNGQLEGKQFVTGDMMTIADLALSSVLTYQQQAQLDMKSFRHMQAWLTRIESRDSWKKTAPKF